MAANTPEAIKAVLAKLQKVGKVKSGHFFGGDDLRLGATQFGMMMGNTVFFTVNDETREKYEKLGSIPFSYLTKNGRVIVRRYYTVPKSVLGSSAKLTSWAKEAVLASKNKKGSRKKKVAGRTAKRAR